MDVKGGAVCEAFGHNIDHAFEDMDGNGEHGLSVTLMTMALDVLDDDAKASYVERVQVLVSQYDARTEPVNYV